MIARVFDITDPASPKPVHGGIKLLEAVSNIIEDKGIVPEGVGAGGGIVSKYVGACVGGSC